MKKLLVRKRAVGLLLSAMAANTSIAIGRIQAQTTFPNRAAAQAVFERLKKLSGDWHGKSTKGWEEPFVIRTLAKGSAIMLGSAHTDSDSAMVTIFYMDQDRLRLDHYCEARNQPRLLATSISEDGRKITFTFLEGTNLPSRDHGHMDKLVLTLVDDNHFTRRWTWYQNGKEQWLEEIESERLKPSGKNP